MSKGWMVQGQPHGGFSGRSSTSYATPGRSQMLLALCLLTGCLAEAVAGNITVDAAKNKRQIDPRIYGVAHATTAELSLLNSPLNRSGGNNTSRYNWLVNADNRGFDWYFESLAYSSPTAGEYGDTFIANSRLGGAEPMLTIPMIEWIARLGTGRGRLCSYSISKYGAQTGSDWEWFPDAGNGVLTSTGQAITNNDPTDANTTNNSTIQQAWVQHLTNRWGTATGSGLKYYILDNEHSIWHSTHRDARPVAPAMEEIRNKMLDFGGMIKARDANAIVIGPEEWGWSGYVSSGYDQQYCASHGWGYQPDRAAHGNMDYLPWLLDQFRQTNALTGRRILDVFTVHYYPQGGEFSDDVSTAMQLRRNRSTRSMWDTNYVDETWIGTQIHLVSRLKQWVASYYPGTLTGITEYNWGAEGHMNGATAQADLLGIFGREGLDMATRWTTPASTSLTFKAMMMYRNYDGSKSAFGETSVSTVVSNADNVSAFSAIRTNDNALTIMAINKMLTTNDSASITITNYPVQPTGQVWRLTSAGTIQRLADVVATSNVATVMLPAQSITLFVFPCAGVSVNVGGGSTGSTNLVLSWQGQTGLAYRVETLTNLFSQWQPVPESLYTNFTGANRPVSYTNFDTSPLRFFRIRWWVR